LVAGSRTESIAGSPQTFDASPITHQNNAIPDQINASRSSDANSALETPAQRAIEAMRLAHLQEAVARATGRPVVLDPKTEAMSMRLDQEFADAELKAKAAILAAEAAHQK
jgi:hypothetical protein